jgi:hypothetical protein
MRMKYIQVSLFVPFVLSAVLHAAAITLVPSFNILGLAGLFSGKVLCASLVQEGPAKSHAVSAVTGARGVYSAPRPSYEEDVKAERKGDGAGEQEASEAGHGRTAEGETVAENGGKAVGSEGLPAANKDGAKTVGHNTAVAESADRSAPGDAAPPILNFSREKFYYDIYWVGIYVGNAVLEAVNKNGIISITSEVHSAPFISTFYKVEDYAESRVKDGRPFNFRIRQREGKYRSDKETIFDMGSGKITYYDYLKGTKDEHVTTDSMFWDVISGFYYLRTQGIAAEKTVFVDIFDSNKFLNAEVNVLGMERIKFTEKREIDAIVVKPILKSDGLFQNKGDIRIWLSNDENRFPVRVETKVPIGNVVAELKQVETEK